MRLKGNPEKWLAALQSPDEELWKEATMMMGGLNPSHKFSPEPFRLALASTSKDVVFWSIIALGGLGKKSKCSIVDLAPLAKHSSVAIQQSALIALADIAPSDAFVKRTIFGAFLDRRPTVRAEALRAVIRLRRLERRDFRRVRRMLADPNDEDVRYYAEITIRNIEERKRIRGGAA